MKHILAAAILVLASPTTPTFAGNSVNGGPAQTGPVIGAASGNDTVTADGAFAGAYTQNPANAGGKEAVTVNPGAVITVPAGIYNRPDSKTRTVTGTTYTDHYFYNGLFDINQGAIDNQGSINGTYLNRPASTQAFGLDQFIDGVGLPNTAVNQNYHFADGIFAWSSQVSQFGPTTIVNGSASNTGATIKGVMTGSGQGFANGIQALEYYGPTTAASLTVTNYGTVDGEVQNHDGTAAGINCYSLYGGLTVTNYASGICSATAPYYTTGIYGQVYYGDSTLQNAGLATATATGGKQGVTANKAYAAGIDLFDFAGNINATNTGTATGVSGGAATNVCYGVFLWAQGGSGTGGAMTFTNSGTVTATSSSDTQAAAKTVYCGGNGGTQTVINTGSITGVAGPGGGWALGVENDNSDPINITNSGTISHNNGLGVGVFIGSGPTTIRNTGSLYGGLTGISAQTYHGSMTIYDHGPLGCGAAGNGAMVLGSGNDTAYLYGLPAVSGLLDGGGGSNTLSIHLTGVLQSVNSVPANSGPSLSSYSLGTSGSIVVSGQTYAWKNFIVAGSTAATNIANGTYKIINRLSGKALGALLTGTANGTYVGQATYGGGNFQRWTLTSLGNGRYKIIGVGSGQSLDVVRHTKTNGTRLKISNYKGGVSQQWVLTPTERGYYTITNQFTPDLCLDVAGASTSDGALVNLWSLDDADAAAGGADQQWVLQTP